MSETYKILGQTSPAATTNTTLYTVPTTGTKGQVVVSVLWIANTTAGGIAIRVFCVPSGSSAAQTNALIYGRSLAANTEDATLKGLTLRSGDSIVVYAAAVNVVFTLFGTLIN
jgi:hypothetical protein